MRDSKLWKKIKQAGVSLTICILGFLAVNAQPNAVLEVEVTVENGANSQAPKSPGDFRFLVEREGEPTEFRFQGSEQAVIVPLAAGPGHGTEFSIVVLSTYTEYLPVFEGSCEADGSVLIAAGEQRSCRITMAFLSFREEAGQLRVVKITSLFDAPGERPENIPQPGDIEYRIETNTDFRASFTGAPGGVLIGLSRNTGFFAVTVSSGPDSERYLPSFRGGCNGFGGNWFVECEVTHTLVHERIDPKANSILKLKWSIERFDPSGAEMPSLSDFEVEIFDETGSRIARLRGSEFDTNLGLETLGARPREITIEPRRGGRLARYVAFVDCGDSIPIAEVVESTLTECLIEYYWVDHLVSETADRLLRVKKVIENSGLPGETADESDFEFDIRDETGALVTTFRGARDVFILAGISGRTYRVEERPHARYAPIYSGDCGIAGEPRIAYFRDCEVTNYSVVESEPGADSIIRVRTTVHSSGDPSPQPPSPSSFTTSILRSGDVLFSQPGSPVYVNFAVRAREGVTIDVPPNENNRQYKAAFASECLDMNLLANKVVECEIGMAYVLESEDDNSNELIRISKTVENSIGTDRPRISSDFRLGVFEHGAVQPMFQVPGSTAGVYVTVSSSTVVRELNSGPDYVPIYSGDCLEFGRASNRDCRIMNVFVGAVPPQAIGQTVTLPEDTSRPIVLSAIDPNSSSLAYKIVSGPTRGTLSGTAPNLTYTPNANFNGTDSFSFRARDAQFDSNDAVVTINVTPVNDAPVASGRSASVITETSTSIALTATDVDGNALTASVVGGPSNGTVSFNGLTANYTSRNDFVGADSFTFRVSDGQTFSNTATVTVNVQNGIAISSAINAEGNSGVTQMVFNVELLAPSLSNVSVNYATQNFTALAGTDYTAKAGTVRFIRGGPLVMPITVDVLGDRVFEQSEVFRVNFSNTVGAVLRNNFVTGTILNDDPQVGIASMSPTELTVDTKRPFTIDLTWIHPERWRLLDEIEFRIVDDTDTAMWVKFEENGTQLPFRQFNVKSRKYGKPVLPGADVVFDTNLAKMFVANSVVIGSGPTGPSATVRPSLQFKPKARGRTFRVELFVSDDLGNLQGWEHVGNITVR